MIISKALAVFGGILAFVGLSPNQGDARPGPNFDWHNAPLPGLDGQPLNPLLLEGKVVLVVNTASFCGFTRQYQGLQDLWARYRDQGLVVLGIPSNDFGGQEPDAEAKIKGFCETAFGVNFPMLAKQVVSGPGAFPLYLWAARRTGEGGVPRWNFHKLLIGRDGNLLGWFGSAVAPDAEQLTRAIKAALVQPESKL
ncbi:MAG: glutathione peroxidase [Rhodospirillaceae bacterium]